MLAKEDSPPESKALMPPETCPNCVADVPPRARACPECGADENTGWSEQARYDSLDLPEESFDHDDFVKREFGTEGQRSFRGKKRFWQIVALLLTLGILYWLFRRWL